MLRERRKRLPTKLASLFYLIIFIGSTMIAPARALDLPDMPCRSLFDRRNVRQRKLDGRRQVNLTKPDLCCGSRPFSSQTHMCCAGKILDRREFACCLDGSFVPKQSICLCHPTSSWTTEQIEKLIFTEKVLHQLIIDSLEIEASLQQKIVRLQEDIEFMDRRAQDLYGKLVKLIGADGGQDRLEVDHIIKLVLFLNENEESIESAKKNMNNLNRNGTVRMGERLKLRSLRSALQWSRKLKVLLTQEIQVSLENERQLGRTQDIVMERESILGSLSSSNQLMIRLEAHSARLRMIASIIRSDSELVGHMQSLLDQTLTVVVQMEGAYSEERNSTAPSDGTRVFALAERRQDVAVVGGNVFYNRRSTLKGRGRVDAAGAAHQNCNFQAWESFVQRIEERVPLIAAELKVLSGVDERSPLPTVSLVQQHYMMYLHDPKLYKKVTN